MREVYLEGRLMTDRAAAHAEIKDKLSLPGVLWCQFGCSVGLPDRNRRGDGYYSPSSRRYVFCPAGIWLPFADDIF